MLETFKESQKGVHHLLSAASNNLVFRKVQKVAHNLGSVYRCLDSVVDIPGFIAPVAALVKPERKKFVTRQNRIKDRCRQFVKAGTKMDTAYPWYRQKEVTDCPPTSPTTRRTYGPTRLNANSLATEMNAMTRDHSMPYR